MEFKVWCPTSAEYLLPLWRISTRGPCMLWGEVSLARHASWMGRECPLGAAQPSVPGNTKATPTGVSFDAKIWSRRVVI